MARRCPTARTSSRAISLDDIDSRLPLRPDDPPERHRAHPGGAPREARRQGRTHRRAGELQGTGQRRRSGAAQGERRERDADGGLADRLRRRPFGGATRARASPSTARRSPATGIWPTATSPGSSRRTAAHLLAHGRHPGVLPDHRGTLAGHRRSRPGARATPTVPIRPCRRSRPCITLRGTAGIVIKDAYWLAAFRINERKVVALPPRPRLPGRRRRPYPQPGRRPGHEHRHAGRLQPRLEARPGDRRRAASLRCSTATRVERSAVGDMVLKNASRVTDAAIIRNPIVQGTCATPW